MKKKARIRCTESAGCGRERERCGKERVRVVKRWFGGLRRNQRTYVGYLQLIDHEPRLWRKRREVLAMSRHCSAMCEISSAKY